MLPRFQFQSLMCKKSQRSPLVVGMAALSNQIFVGRLSKDGRTWKNGKQDVTSDVLQSVIQFVGVDKEIVVNVGGKPKYRIRVTDIEAK